MKRKEEPAKNGASLASIAESLVKAARDILPVARTEEDLKIRFERVLGPLIEGSGIEFEEQYERGSAAAKTILRGKRPDAMHGQVVVEYERPEAFKSSAALDHAYGQLTEYLGAEAIGLGRTEIAGPVGIVGVGFDGSTIFFVRCRSHGKTAKGKDARLEFVMDGPHPFEPRSALTFVTCLRALSRVALTADNLADRFGPKAAVAREAVAALADAMENWPNPRADVLFREWQRLFGIVYGEQFGGGDDPKTAALAQTYGLPASRDFQAILFCVHTYFALLMKLIAAELLLVGEGGLGGSLSSSLSHGSSEELLKQLSDVEDGGIYNARGISNFLEGDFFRWYLEAFGSPRLQDAIRAIARVLSQFEPATTTIEPQASHDLLKRLYQYLVPDVVRHRLGEYYTPDWLAELVLDETGYRGDTRKRVLDPACGSGTFLSLVIQRARAFGGRKGESGPETARRILANVWGFDLNPLAVIAARTNYLFGLGDLVKTLGPFEIPVYLADSVLWPKRTGQMMLIGNGAVEITTSVGTFFVPKIWVDQHGFLMRRAAPIVEETARMKWDVSEAMARFKKEGLVYPPHEAVVADFYEHVLELEKDGKNGIWARFLKNVFAPMTAERFDYVVGNPPWIRWGYLSNEYRQATMEMWQDYGLFSLKGHAARLGGGEKDFSMLFTYAAADHYLAGSGTLGFLITQEVFKSKGAGEGFRKFRLGDRETLKVVKAHDLASVQPFEKAANKTAAIILKKRGRTQYPVPYTVWTRKKGVGRVPTDMKLRGAKKLLDRQVLLATPIGKVNGSWQTVRKGDGRLRHIEGQNAYTSRLGARVEPYGVFWLDVREILSDGHLIVRNMVEKGKRRIRQVEVRIEPDLVYPAVRGADIERWGAKPGIYVLVVQELKKRRGHPEVVMKAEWPRTFVYLSGFRKELLGRAAYKKYHADTDSPFYSQYNIAGYTFARYKVVWKRMAGDLVAAVIGQHKTQFGWKMIVPTDTTSLFATERQDEAHYLCAILNSSPVRDFVRSYSSAGRGFGAPSVMEHVGIPKFDPNDKRQARLSELSKGLHRLRSQGLEDEMGKMEKEVDEAVWTLFEGGKR